MPGIVGNEAVFFQHLEFPAYILASFSEQQVFYMDDIFLLNADIAVIFDRRLDQIFLGPLRITEPVGKAELLEIFDNLKISQRQFFYDFSGHRFIDSDAHPGRQFYG